MFFPLESKKKKNKARNDEKEKVPLARSHSLYNPQRDKYATKIHSPPLIVHTPEMNRRKQLNHYGIPMLADSPKNKRSHSDQFNDYLDRRRDLADGRDGRMVDERMGDGRSSDGRRTPEGKRLRDKNYRGRRNTLSKNDDESDIVRTTRQINDSNKNYRHRKYKCPAPTEDARRPIKERNSEDIGSTVSKTALTPRRTSRMSIGMLESSTSSELEDESKRRKKELLVYFAELAKSKDSTEKIDLKKINRLLAGGADLNMTDKFGQTIMHEIARNWHADVAKYLMKKGAQVDAGDKFGRTALHLAAAVGHTEMIEFIIYNNGRLHARTKDENQTPMHYAAKNNAVASMKTLLHHGASINDRDYRSRTPLYLAVEHGRTEAALYLLKIRAPAAVYDDQGISCLSIMVQKMPDVAIVALQQFYTEDQSLRKRYCYLNYLENKLTAEEEEQISWKYLSKYDRHKQKREMSLVSMISKKELKKEEVIKSVLERIVEHNEVRIVSHPAIRLLIDKKWNAVGQRAATFGFLVNLIYAIIWTAIGIATPITGEEIYRPFSSWWHVIALEVVGVGLTIYFMASHIMEAQIIKRRNIAHNAWNTVQAEKDLRFCHPRWPDEKRHVTETIEATSKRKQSGYFSCGWNCFDWLVYVLVLIVMITRLLNLILAKPSLEFYHVRIFSVSQIFIWLRIVRRLRPFPTFGPFIVMLGYVVVDTFKFLVLFLIFFIPYCCAFWIIFAGEKIKDGLQKSSFARILDLMYHVFQISVIGEFNWDSLVTQDKNMAQILTGSYMAIVSVVCLSLYIAFLTNTFARIYPQAKARALLIQAAKILFAERSISKSRKLEMKAHIHEDCAPWVEDLRAEKVIVATNVSSISITEFNDWRNRHESEADEIKQNVKELNTKQEQMMNHFKLILVNMDDQDDLVEEI